MTSPVRIESLLAARQFLVPQLDGDRVFFVSDLSGRLSLYAMDLTGSIPEPLLPPHVALQNPHLMEGLSFKVMPEIGQILVMIDSDGDENYQPMLVPIDGGFPRDPFNGRFEGSSLSCAHVDTSTGRAILTVDLRNDPIFRTVVGDLKTGEVTEVARSLYGRFCLAQSPDLNQLILSDSYTFGDCTLYRWTRDSGGCSVLFGTPLEQRDGEVVPNGIATACFVSPDAIVVTTSLFEDTYGLGYLDLAKPGEIREVRIDGLTHTGLGELEGVEGLGDQRVRLTYNIDGCSYVYHGRFEDSELAVTIEEMVCGQGALESGVLEAISSDQKGTRHVFSFSTACKPCQLYVYDSGTLTQLTKERVLGITENALSEGEDASFDSHDGLRVSARMYLPKGCDRPAEGWPVVFYVHGGPQSQERPDFTWFSMPLIQFFTLRGVAVFVPNTRGSSGYGLSYMKRVDKDWGGLDRLDHIAAFDLLKEDPRLDMKRVGVMGRSYGGYMTLTLAGRHPDRWVAACDMFGPYNLLSFMKGIPETWKTYFELSIGHPVRDREFLVERSPSTHLANIGCPLLVIQGANDPRVVESESREVVRSLQSDGKEVAYLVFEDEGHDVIKFENKVRCYNEIVAFFLKAFGQPD